MILKLNILVSPVSLNYFKKFNYSWLFFSLLCYVVEAARFIPSLFPDFGILINSCPFQVEDSAFCPFGFTSVLFPTIYS